MRISYILYFAVLVTLCCVVSGSAEEGNEQELAYDVGEDRVVSEIAVEVDFLSSAYRAIEDARSNLRVSVVKAPKLSTALYSEWQERKDERRIYRKIDRYFWYLRMEDYFHRRLEQDTEIIAKGDEPANMVFVPFYSSLRV